MYVTLHISMTVLRNRSLSDRSLMFLVIDHDKQTPNSTGDFSDKEWNEIKYFLLVFIL